MRLMCRVWEAIAFGQLLFQFISPGLERWEEFTCLNSLREVEPPVKFIISDGGLDGIEAEEETPEQHEEKA